MNNRNSANHNGARCPERPPPVSVSIVGPATPGLVAALWSLGLRPVSGTTDASVWMAPDLEPWVGA
jgi:hypothetical protein